MTPDEFTALARGLGPGIHPKAIFETVQFRVGGKVFATLGWPSADWAVVKVAPSRQAWALSLSVGASLETGRRRKAGIILLRLAALDEAAAAELLAAAWSFAQGAPARQGRAVTATAALGLSA